MKKFIFLAAAALLISAASCGQQTTICPQKLNESDLPGDISYQGDLVAGCKYANRFLKAGGQWEEVWRVYDMEFECINHPVAEDIGLIAFVKKRGGFFIWGGANYYMVFRLADLFRYEYSSERATGSDGKTKVKHFINFAFGDTSGCDAFNVEVMSESSYISVARYFNKCFGLQCDVKSIVDTWQSHVERELYGDRTEWIAKADAAIKCLMIND